jgi:hypothetical protein
MDWKMSLAQLKKQAQTLRRLAQGLHSTMGISMTDFDLDCPMHDGSEIIDRLSAPWGTDLIDKIEYLDEQDSDPSLLYHS